MISATYIIDYFQWCRLGVHLEARLSYAQSEPFFPPHLAERITNIF